jgi:deoxyribodipyrimidine photo-lyase
LHVANPRANLPAMATLLWFRQDLRLSDNPALAAALESNAPVIPVYIHAPDEEGAWPPGAASRWWLHHSLERLEQELRSRGSRLIVLAGSPTLESLLRLARECAATRVVWNRRYEPAIIARDQAIKPALRAAGIEASSFNSALLHEPWTVQTRSGGPFQVFTAFWRHCLSLPAPAEPQPPPRSLPAPAHWPGSLRTAELGLLPATDWAAGLRGTWAPGSVSAHALLEQFLNQGFDSYEEQRDLPGVSGTSRLSPHLHFGEIGPREIWHAVRRFAERRGSPTGFRNSKFLAELGWREFAHHLLYHFPHTPAAPLRAHYASFPWKRDPALADAWTRGSTGFPIVDAAMRELWHTGWMHNRARMIAGSFLVKDLLADWTHGARWFWDTLVDADLANNTLGWQWVAGCGADAAPFFRIFNPALQGAKFDPDGRYVRRWIPRISRLPDEWIHRPWAAPSDILASAGISLGEHYPRPVVDHDVARREALRVLAGLKEPHPAKPRR